MTRKVAMQNIKATHPLELVHLDFLMIKGNEGGKDAHVLVITDHFMCYVQALVTSSQTAKCPAKDMWDRFIGQYGLTENTVYDQGWTFESDLIAELCKLAKIWKLHTGPYKPQTNGQCEHFSHILIYICWVPCRQRKTLVREM